MKDDVGVRVTRDENNRDRSFVGWNNRESKSEKRMEPINGETRVSRLKISLDDSMRKFCELNLIEIVRYYFADPFLFEYFYRLARTVNELFRPSSTSHERKPFSKFSNR